MEEIDVLKINGDDDDDSFHIFELKIVRVGPRRQFLMLPTIIVRVFITVVR